MARQVSSYSTFLTQIAGLVGLPTDRITTEIAGTWNASFNTSIQKMWSLAPWVETTPYGEARILGNRLSYANNLANTSYWTATALTITANSINNPCDGTQTASKLMETVANSAHSVVQTIPNIFPSTTYSVTFYGRPNGRAYQYLSVYDGSTTFSAFFNTSTGTVGTVSNFSTTSIGQQPNGFWVCNATFTSSAAATATGTCTIQLSTDGSTLSYAGDTVKGCYVWGVAVQQTQNTPVQDLMLPWDQVGESAIDCLYNVYAVSPFASNYPPQFGYNETPSGIQIINGTPYQYNFYVNGVAQTNLYGAPPNSPIFIYYRQVCPSYTGDEYSATDTYAVDEQVYFVTSAGVGNFYKCVVATTAGQSPATTPNSWSVIPLYATFVNYCTYMVFGDWLTQNGAMDQAGGAYALAQDRMDTQFDLFERQMQAMSPMTVQSHLTSRSSW